MSLPTSTVIILRNIAAHAGKSTQYHHQDPPPRSSAFSNLPTGIQDHFVSRDRDDIDHRYPPSEFLRRPISVALLCVALRSRGPGRGGRHWRHNGDWGVLEGLDFHFLVDSLSPVCYLNVVIPA